MSDHLADISNDKNLNPVLDNILARLTALENPTQEIPDVAPTVINEISDPLQFFETDANGANPRGGRVEMKLMPDGLPSMVMSFIDATAQTNLVPNPDFETGDDSGHVIASSSDPNYSFAVEMGNAYEGDYAAHIVVNPILNPPFPPTNTNVNLISDAGMTVTPGSRYMLAALIKFIGGAPEIQLSIDWYDVGDTFISSSFVSSKNPTVINEYAECYGSAIAPANAAAARYSIRVFSGGEATDWYIDKISFTIVSMYLDVHFTDDGHFVFDNGSIITKLGAGPEWKAEQTYGTDKNANTAATFFSQVTSVQVGKITKVNKILWDIAATGTYSLYLCTDFNTNEYWLPWGPNGDAYLWHGVVGTPGEVEMVLTEPIVLYPGNIYYFGVKISGASKVIWGALNVASYKTLAIKIAGVWYDGTVISGYMPGIKLVYQEGQWS